jgi:serine phosphatase RsbU (regulator of sigma subunit)
LLPKALPVAAGINTAARYVPGTHGAEVGGDWYDVLVRDDGCVYFVIGDVSGRGIPAAAVMASLRFAIRGFITEGHRPDVVLTSAGRLLDLRADGHFATVLCGLVDLASSRLVVSNAGHLPLVLAGCGAQARLVQTDVDPPIGVAPGVKYRSSAVELPHSGTLLAYTDGLVERRGENLDTGLRRLVGAVPDEPEPLDVMLDELIAALLPQRPTDDTALLGLTWT